MFRPSLRKMTNFKINVVSDTVCPWCFIGKQKLDKAIAIYKEKHPGSDDEFSTTWMPFYLNPDAPRAGVDKKAYFVSKFGADYTKVVFQRLIDAGRDVGIAFNFGGRTGNTRNSHRLIQLAKTKGPAVETRVVEELFKSYFEQEGDITSLDMLQSAAVRAGLPKEEVVAWLNSDQGGKAVDEEVAEAQRNRISGVPNFTVQGKYEVGGAQEPEVFVRLFEKIKAAEAAKA